MNNIFSGRDVWGFKGNCTILYLASWIFLFSLPSRSYACECAGLSFESMKDRIDRSAVVFEGRVESMKIIAYRHPEFGLRPNDLTEFGLYKFNIERSYKGPSSGEIEIVSGQGGGDCSIHLEVGARYVVFAYPGFFWTKSYLETDSCVGTDYLYQAQAQLGFLRGEIHSASQWERLRTQMISPTGADATISGKVRGFRKASQGGIQVFRVINDRKLPYVFGVMSEDGSYQVPVTSGNYVVRALKWPLADPFLIGYYSSAQRMEQATLIKVSQDQNVKAIDFDVKVPRTYVVRGRVQQPLWPPRWPVEMGVSLKNRDQLTLLPERSARCLFDGTFEIKGVYPGRYHVIPEFGFDEPDKSREWRSDIKVIQVPEETTGIVIKVGSKGGNFWREIEFARLTHRWLLPTLLASILILGIMIWLLLTKARRESKPGKLAHCAISTIAGAISFFIFYGLLQYCVIHNIPGDSTVFLETTRILLSFALAGFMSGAVYAATFKHGYLLISTVPSILICFPLLAFAAVYDSLGCRIISISAWIFAITVIAAVSCSYIGASIIHRTLWSKMPQ